MERRARRPLLEDAPISRADLVAAVLAGHDDRAGRVSPLQGLAELLVVAVGRGGGRDEYEGRKRQQDGLHAGRSKQPPFHARGAIKRSRSHLDGKLAWRLRLTAGASARPP